MEIMIIGIDLAKCVFQVHGVDERGKRVLRNQLKRDQVAKFQGQLPSWDGSLWQRTLNRPSFGRHLGAADIGRIAAVGNVAPR